MLYEVITDTGIVSFLAIAAIGLFLYLSLTDFSEYRSEIEEAVTEATGREFRIGSVELLHVDVAVRGRTKLSRSLVGTVAVRRFHEDRRYEENVGRNNFV